MNTMEFRFTRPEGLEFKAGQFGDYTLSNPPETNEKGNIRGFSFSCAPFEEDVMFTTRMEDTALVYHQMILTGGVIIVYD